SWLYAEVVDVEEVALLRQSLERHSRSPVASRAAAQLFRGYSRSRGGSIRCPVRGTGGSVHWDHGQRRKWNSESPGWTPRRRGAALAQRRAHPYPGLDLYLGRDFRSRARAHLSRTDLELRR